MLTCENITRMESVTPFESIEYLDYFIDKVFLDNVSEMDSDASPRSFTPLSELTTSSTQTPPPQRQIETVERAKQDESSSSDEDENEKEVALPAGEQKFTTNLYSSSIYFAE